MSEAKPTHIIDKDEKVIYPAAHASAVPDGAATVMVWEDLNPAYVQEHGYTMYKSTKAPKA